VAGSSSQSWRVALSCPQCGGPIDIEEASRLFACAYCRVRLFMDPGETPRYHFECETDGAEETFYAPYWRYRGLFFRLIGAQVQGSAVDANLLALPESLFPASLGLRPQTQTLKFVSPQTSGRFFKAGFGLTEATRRIQERLLRVSQALEGETPAAFVGETAGLIYAPFINRDGVLRDAILNRPTRGRTGAEDLDRLEVEAHQDWTPAFLPALCPSCGWDLNGDEQSRVLNCSNCGRLWKAADGKYQEVTALTLPGGAAEDRFLPFWRIQPQVDGLNLDSYADLARLANIPKVALAAWREEPFHFMIPAFHLPPRLFLRLGRQMTLHRPDEPPEPLSPGRTLHPVHLTLSQTVEGLKLNLAHLSAVKRDLAETLAGVRVQVKQAALVYVPFRASGADLVYAAGRIGIGRAALLRERNL